MSTNTTNLGLIKPGLTDAADITSMNENWDKIDSALGAVKLTAEDDLNTITKSGYYYWDAEYCPRNSPNDEDSFYSDSTVSMRVWTGVNNDEYPVCLQEVTVMEVSLNNRGCVIRRYIEGDDCISEWEWVNPPMLVDTYYRTTERFLGEAVYIYLDPENYMVRRFYRSYQDPGGQYDLVEITPIQYTTDDIEAGSISSHTNGTVLFVIE